MVDKNLRYGRFVGINVLHDSPTRAARFVRDTLTATDVDRDFCYNLSRLGGGDNECERVAGGGCTFQFMKPDAALPGSQDFFDKYGNAVYAYQLEVDDVDAAAKALEAGGAKIVANFAGDDRKSHKAVYGTDGDPVDFAVVDARQQCGLQFEIVKKDPDLVCRTGLRYPTDQGVFMHAEIVVPNSESAAKFMMDVMGAEHVEKNIDSRIEEIDNGCIHVLYGGLVFQLIEPAPMLTGWGAQLEAMGPSTRLICYHFRNDLQPRVDEFTKRGALQITDPDAAEETGEGQGWVYAAGDADRELPVTGEGAFTWMYHEDADDGERTFKFQWLDTIEQCGLNWEFLEQSYQWISSTGYFFNRE